MDTEPPEDEEPPADDDGPSDDEEPVDDEEPSEDDDAPAVDCVDQFIDARELPLSLEGAFAPGGSRFQPSCVGAVSGELTFSFTAPRGANYLFDTQGSSFDTVLYALGPTCEPPELACNDDYDDLTSQIGLGMLAGETAVIVIDSFGATGEWSLQVREGGICPTETLDPNPEVYVEGVLDSTQLDSVVPSCAGAGPDVVYTWTPPFSGRWRISTAGSSFDTVLAVFSDDCVTELACNDDGPNDVSSMLDLELDAGVPVAIAVDSFGDESGSFQLSIFPS